MRAFEGLLILLFTATTVSQCPSGNTCTACQVTGCTKADLLTSAAEANFTDWTIADDFELRNTVLDCRQCHQPGGPGTRSVLRMQELLS